MGSKVMCFLQGNVTFRKNTAHMYGGGIHMKNGVRLAGSGVSFENNKALNGSGGAIYTWVCSI